MANTYTIAPIRMTKNEMVISLERPNSVAASSRKVGEGVALEFRINPADMTGVAGDHDRRAWGKLARFQNCYR